MEYFEYINGQKIKRLVPHVSFGKQVPSGGFRNNNHHELIGMLQKIDEKLDKVISLLLTQQDISGK